MKAVVALAALAGCSDPAPADVVGKVPPGKPPHVKPIPKPKGEGFDLANLGSANPRPMSLELDGKTIRIDPHRGVDAGVYGSLEDGGTAVFTVHGNRMIGTIRRGRDVYHVIGSDDGGPPRTIKAPPGRKKVHGEEQGRQGDPVAKVNITDSIHVLVAYTAVVAKKCKAEPTCGNPLAFSQLAIATTNQVARDSGTSATFKLAGTYAIAETFDESDLEMRSILDLLVGTNPGTALAGVKAERAAKKADIVVVLTDIPGMIQGQTALTPASKTTAFSIVNWDAAITQLAFVHEIGHQLGLNDDSDRCSTATYKSGFGFHHPSTTDPDSNWVTVMSNPFECTPECVRIARWSNPARQYKGVATGVRPTSATNQPCANEQATARNEASVITDTAGAIAQFF